MIQKAVIICEGGHPLCPPNGTEVFVKPSKWRDNFLRFSLDGEKWLGQIFSTRFKMIEDEKPKVLPATCQPPATIKREVLTIGKIGVGQTFIVHGKPGEVYVKISNSHVFNHKLLQMHNTDANRFQRHLNLVAVELVVYDGE